ncbi:hypothetical protein E2C01_083275 [Portunus trituberculatus]|uniref:Uncharacterized protein n=1 Tax=Portunus trituberculatus TaxID=210409 RepID=A0A5B7J1J4_PORTR|nr:hypothetical protein [Portunus trituberculatus]
MCDSLPFLLFGVISESASVLLFHLFGESLPGLLLYLAGESPCPLALLVPWRSLSGLAGDREDWRLAPTIVSLPSYVMFSSASLISAGSSLRFPCLPLPKCLSFTRGRAGGVCGVLRSRIGVGRGHASGLCGRGRVGDEGGRGRGRRVARILKHCGGPAGGVSSRLPPPAPPSEPRFCALWCERAGRVGLQGGRRGWYELVRGGEAVKGLGLGGGGCGKESLVVVVEGVEWMRLL